MHFCWISIIIINFSNNDVTLEDVVSAFPLSKYGNYHFRFRIGDRSEVNWVDISNIDDKIPLYYDYIWVKCLRLGND